MAASFFLVRNRLVMQSSDGLSLFIVRLHGSMNASSFSQQGRFLARLGEQSTWQGIGFPIGIAGSTFGAGMAGMPAAAIAPKHPAVWFDETSSGA